MEAGVSPQERSTTRKMSSSSGSANGKRSSKKRVRNFSADDRAAHRIFEKGRREAFRERLVALASFLPALTETEANRLSKHVVVDESIARHKLQQSRCSDALREMRALLSERDELLAEVNEWRSHYGTGQTPLKTRAVNADAAISGLAEIESEVYPSHGESSTASSADHAERESSQGNESDEWQGVLSGYSEGLPPPWDGALTGDILANSQLLQSPRNVDGQFNNAQVSAAANSLVVLDVPPEHLLNGQDVSAGLDGLDLSLLQSTNVGEGQTGLHFGYGGTGLTPFADVAEQPEPIPFEQYLKPFSGYIAYGYPSVLP